MHVVLQKKVRVQTKSPSALCFKTQRVEVRVLRNFAVAGKFIADTYRGELDGRFHEELALFWPRVGLFPGRRRLILVEAVFGGERSLESGRSRRPLANQPLHLLKAWKRQTKN
jgi:hypothetical protein